MADPSRLFQAIQRYRQVKGLDQHRRQARRFPNAQDVRRQQVAQTRRKKLSDLMLQQRGGR